MPETKKKKLSQIIAEINLRMGKDYDNDAAVKAVLQIRDLMMNSDFIKKTALNNSEKDFELAFYDNLDKALVKGIEQNRDFFTLLLKNKDLKQETIGLFIPEIYKSIRTDNGIVEQ